MKKLIIPILSLVALASCTKEKSTCTCTNYARNGIVEAKFNDKSQTECNYYQVKYQQVYGSDVICELN